MRGYTNTKEISKKIFGMLLLEDQSNTSYYEVKDIHMNV